MIKFKIKTLIACFIFGMNLNAQNWTRTLSTSNADNEVGILKANDSDGSLINVNNVVINGQNDIIVTRLFSDGSLNWSKRYTMTGASETITSFILDRNNDIVMVGSTVTSGVQKGLVIKVSFSTGNVLFSRRTQSSGTGAYFRRVIQMNSGYSDDYVILGTVNYPTTNIVARINGSNGNTVWAHNHNVVLGNTDLFYTLSQVNNDDIVIGCGLYNGSNSDQAVVHLAPGNGARKAIKVWNVVNGSANNGGFDDAVVIPGTDTILFSMVQNGGGAATKHGYAVYDAGAKNLVTINLHNQSTNNSRATKIDYDPMQRQILLGGAFGATYQDNFAHVVNYDNDATIYASKFDATINRSAFKLNYSWISFVNASDFLVANTVIPLGVYANSNEIVIARTNQNGIGNCFDSLSMNDVLLNIPNPSITSMDSTNQTIDSVGFSVSNYDIYDTLRCEYEELVRRDIQNVQDYGINENQVFPLPFMGVAKSDFLSVSLFPNPSNGSEQIKLEIKNLLQIETNVQVYDAQGNLIYSTNVKGESADLELNVSEFEKGLYVLKISNDRNSTFSKFQVN